VSALSAAFDDLRRRAQQADEAGDWRERLILEPLASVADYVKRIGEHGVSAHYRADKAGDLVASALRVQREAVLAYARSERGEDDAADDELHRAARALAQAAVAVEQALWSMARGWADGLPVDGLLRAAQALSAAVEAQAADRW
jgi:hypothetical protein